MPDYSRIVRKMTNFDVHQVCVPQLSMERFKYLEKITSMEKSFELHYVRLQKKKVEDTLKEDSSA